MAQHSNLTELGSGKILPLLLRYAWPAVVTMTLNQLYNIVDRVYIGHWHAPGPDAAAAVADKVPDTLAGITLTFPFMGILAAIGVLIGMGSSSVLSIKLGQKDMDGAEKALGQCVALKVLFGLIFPPLLFFFGIDPILRYMAGENITAAALGYGRQYLSITLFFNIFAHLGFGLSATMRAEGSPKQSMYCMVVGAVTNLVLDPIFIYGFGWGVAGAAWATNISMMACCGGALYYYSRGNSVVKLRLSRIRVYRDLVGRVLAIGLSPCFMQLMGALIVFSLNHAFARWAGADATLQIAAFGIANSVAFLFHIPSQGVQQGIAPIIGFNWGAQNHARVLHALKLGLLLTAAATIFACLCLEIFAPGLAWCFDDTPNTVRAGAYAIRVANIMIWSIFVNVAATTYFQAVGRPRTAILLSLLRQCFILLPIVWILPHFMPGNPVLAIWIAFPVSDFLTALATIPPILKERRALALAAAKSAAEKGVA